MTESKTYPYMDGDFTIIGPECFIYADGNVLSYQGQEYLKPCGEFVSDKEDGGQTFCVRRVEHGGMYHEDFEGKTKLRAEADGPGEFANLDVIWPRDLSTGDALTKEQVKEAFDWLVSPTRSAGEQPGPELRAVMGVMRHVYGAMPDNG